ncbi:MAG: hypothetical protein HY744_17320, partial [Deltaproteobacteria bacterium]|nr:hypothetical protein [Deltaproteobacteria bacterium]
MRVQRALRGVGAARRDRLARGALLAAAALWPALIACASQRAAVPGAAAPVWLPSATPASGALGPAPAALPPPWPAQAPVELELVAPKGAGRWTLRSAWGQVVCELPCTVPLWPQSRLWLRREVGTAEDEERVRIPDFFTYPPGGRLRAVVIPARDAAWAELPLLLGLLAAQVGWVTAASQCGAFSRKNEGLSPPACELGLDVLAAGGFVAMAGGALWYFYDREASLRVAPPAAGGARGREAVRWPGREQPRVEVEAHGGMAVPTCYLGGCADVGVGATLGGLVLLRPLPRWAFGAVGEHAQYPWDLR